jgi:hypothetical protein
MTFTINGTSIIPYIAQGGIKWQRSDIDSPSTGRTLDGKMHRGRITTKIRLDITCKPLMASDLQTVLNLIAPEYVTVVYDDPMYGRVLKQMYSNNNPASFFFINDKGEELWNNITFPLIEV